MPRPPPARRPAYAHFGFPPSSSRPTWPCSPPGSATCAVNGSRRGTRRSGWPRSRGRAHADRLPPRGPTTMLMNALTVDVEEYFHAAIFRTGTQTSGCHDFESRLEASVDRLLGLLRTSGAKATFFTLGEIAMTH